MSSQIPQQIGPYKVLEELGRGSMGVVYKGIHEESRHFVAIKFFKLVDHSPQSIAAQQRFFREAESMRRVRHENVVHIYESGRLGYLSYLIIEYIDGPDLRRILKTESRIDVPRVKDWIQQLANGLEAIHVQGFVHRDLKPANIMIQNGRVKIADFGLVRDDQGMDLTATNAMVGTPAYMSPEQIRGEKDIDGRSDLFSLGILVHELLSGRNPFEAINIPDTARAICQRQVKALDSIDPMIPSALASVIGQCLEKERANRPRSASELKTLLNAADSTVSGVPLREGSRRHGSASLIIAGLILALCLAVVWGVMSAMELRSAGERLNTSQDSLNSAQEQNTDNLKQLEKFRSQSEAQSAQLVDLEFQRINGLVKNCNELLQLNGSLTARRHIARKVLSRLKALERRLSIGGQPSDLQRETLANAYFELAKLFRSPKKCRLFDLESAEFCFDKALLILRVLYKKGRAKALWAKAELFVALTRALTDERFELPRSSLPNLVSALPVDLSLLFTVERLSALLFKEAISAPRSRRIILEAYSIIRRRSRLTVYELYFMALCEKKFSKPFYGVSGLKLNWEMVLAPEESRESAYARSLIQVIAARMTTKTSYDRGFDKRLIRANHAVRLYPNSLTAIIAFTDTVCLRVLGGRSLNQQRLLPLTEMIERFGQILDVAPTGFMTMSDKLRVMLVFRPVMMLYQVGETSLARNYCNRYLGRWKRHIPKQLEGVLLAIGTLSNIDLNGSGLMTLERFDNSAMLNQLTGRNTSQPLSFELRLLDVNSQYAQKRFGVKSYLAELEKIFRDLLRFRHVKLEYFARLKVLFVYFYWRGAKDACSAGDPKLLKARSVVLRTITQLNKDLTDPLSISLVNRIKRRLSEGQK